VKTSGRLDVEGGWSVVVVSTLGTVTAHPSPGGGVTVRSTATGSVRVTDHDTPSGVHCRLTARRPASTAVWCHLRY